MSKALAVLELFFSLVSINSTETLPAANRSTGGNVTSVATAVTSMSSVSGIAFVGRAFRISIPRVSKLQLSMKTEHNGDIRLSSWIQFDKDGWEVFGFPLPGNEGVFTYKLVPINRKAKLDDNKATILFKLNVQRSIVFHNHEIALKTGTNFYQFMTRVTKRVDFVTRLSRYCFNENSSFVWIKSFSKVTKELTVVFTNIPSSSCDENVLKRLKSSMVDKDSKVNSYFQIALTPQFPIESVRFKLFAPCNENMFGPKTSFQWGWLKHFLPIAILFCVIGIPVAISILVNKLRAKPPALVESRRSRTLERRKEDGTDFSFHTVHFNNRYPSIRSSLSSSKEDCIEEEEKRHAGRLTIPNGSLMVQNSYPKRPKKVVAEENKSKNNNPLKFAINDRSAINIRAMWDEDDFNGERPPLNIPVYYTYRNDQDEEPSMLDAVMDMNFFDLAGNISTNLREFKSMLNVSPVPGGEGDTNFRPSLSSKLKGFGKSMSVSLRSNEPSVSVAETSSSLSSKLRCFGKSMLNISSDAQKDESKPTEDNSRKKSSAAYEYSNDSDVLIYGPREYEEMMNERNQEGKLWTDNFTKHITTEYELCHNSRRLSALSDYDDSDAYDDFFDQRIHEQTKGTIIIAPTNYNYDRYYSYAQNMNQKCIFNTEINETAQVGLRYHCPYNRPQDHIDNQSLYQDVYYHEYLNPSEYCNGVARSKSTQSLLGATFSSQSSYGYWGRDECEKEHTAGMEFSPGKSANVFCSLTKSAPDLGRNLGKGSFPYDTKSVNKGTRETEISFL